MCLFSPPLSHLHVPVELREGRQASVCVCARVCMWNAATQLRREKKERAKTDRNKPINRWIEIDRLTARWGKIRERRHEQERAQRLRDEDSGRWVLKKLYTHKSHTRIHIAATQSDWQRPTDTPTDWKKHEWKESDGGKGKDRERRSDPQLDTNRKRQQRDKQKDRQTNGSSNSHLLYLSVCVLSCSV